VERLRELAAGRVLAVAGIAEPERFFAMLESAGLTIDRLPLPDHASLDPRPWPETATRIVLTEKDAARIDPRAPDAAAIDVVTLDFVLPAGTVRDLCRLLPPPSSRSAAGATKR
jgi:tetraacyldisaccharide 4'-kinase